MVTYLIQLNLLVLDILLAETEYNTNLQKKNNYQPFYLINPVTSLAYYSLQTQIYSILHLHKISANLQISKTSQYQWIKDCNVNEKNFVSIKSDKCNIFKQFLEGKS